MDLSSLSLDTETIGLEADAQLLEIAVANLAACVLIERLVRPAIEIPDGAFEIQGTWGHRVAKAMSGPTVQAELVSIVAGRAVYIYNAAYELGEMPANALAEQLEPTAIDAHSLMEFAAQ